MSLLNKKIGRAYSLILIFLVFGIFSSNVEAWVQDLQVEYNPGDQAEIIASQTLLEACSGTLYFMLEVYDIGASDQDSNHYRDELSSSIDLGENLGSGYNPTKEMEFTLPQNAELGTWSISSYLYCPDKDPRNANQYSTVNEISFRVVEEEDFECGDNSCEVGEVCAEDCFEVKRFISAPASLTEGQSVEVRVRVENDGTEEMEQLMEVGLIPLSWEGDIGPIRSSKSAIVDIPNCVPENEFYESLKIELEGGESETLRFTIQAPSRDSTDHVSEKSAWGDGFYYVAGFYNACWNEEDGGGYTDYITKDDISISTLEDPICDNDNFCDEDENNGNCPNDCPAPPLDDEDECDSNSDCDDGYECNQVSGPDECVEIEYEDECSNYNDYFCDGTKVKHCVDNGNYWEEKTIKTCSGKHEYCDPNVVDGTQTCSLLPSNLNVWIDYADSGVEVNKQIGDILKLNIYSETSGNVNIKYDEDVFEGNCHGNFNLNSGENECELVVQSGSRGEVINVDNKLVVVNVLDEVDFLIVTDSKQLHERFESEENGVKAVLKQAYAMAGRKGVVYDLDWYDLDESNLFERFRDYFEKLIRPEMEDNSYSIAASNFIKNKCGDCEDVLILGDDFVIPHYRREIPTLEKEFIFFNNKDVKDIYTDIPYIKKKTLEFSNYYEMFKKEDRYEGKNVLIILPNEVDSSLREEIDNLRHVFRDYNPDFEEVSGNEVYCVDESWWSEVTGKSLIIIGTEENNNAFNCMPFVSGDTNRDAVFMQPNVWDNEEYAVVINTNNAQIVGLFASMIEDGGVVDLKGESAHFFHIGTRYVGYAAMGVGVGSLVLFSGGTAPLVFVTTSWVLEAIADSSDVVDTCKVNKEGIGWCGASVGFAVVPYVGSVAGKNVIRNFDDTVLNDQLFSIFNSYDDLFKKHFKNLRNSKGIGNEAFEKAIKTADDNKFMADGADKLLQGGSLRIDDFPIVKLKGITPDGLAESVKNIGKLKNTDLITKYKEGVIHPNGESWIERAMKVNNPGIIAEAKRGAEALKQGEEVIALGKFIDKIEIDLIAKKGTKGIAESIKNSDSVIFKDLNRAIGDLVRVKGKNIEGSIKIEKLRLAITERRYAQLQKGLDNPTTKKFFDDLDANDIELVTFKGVR